MADIWLPYLKEAKLAPRLMDKTGRFVSPIAGTVRTVKRSGSRWGMRIDYQSLHHANRAKLQRIISQQGGAENRLLYSPGDSLFRGGFPAAEILQNNTFSAGTNSWTVGPDYAISSVDKVLRCKRVAVTVQSRLLLQGVNVTPFFPYYLRTMTMPGRGTQGSVGPIVPDIASLTGALGLKTCIYMPEVSSYALGLLDLQVSGAQAGDYFDLQYISSARCALVDNASNLLLNSDVFNSTGWSPVNVTSAPNGTQAPDGSTAAFALTESSANAQHYMSQVVGNQGSGDYAVSVYAAPGVRRTVAILSFVDQATGSVASAYFNMTTGAVGMVGVTGTTLASPRGFIESAGGGWYRCTLVVTKSNGASVVESRFGAASSDGVGSYAGVTGATAILMWRASLGLSGSPTRAQSTLGAPNAGQLQSGNAVYVKGLPLNATGLVREGDWFEINQELKVCTASLDSNGAGLGYLQFAPPIRFAPADNSPVIFCNPVGRFILNDAENGWTSNPGIFSDYSLDLVEALEAS